MKPRPDLCHYLVLLLALLVPLLAAAFLGRDLFAAAVVLPLEYLAWLGKLAGRMIPQSVVWGVLCAAALVVVLVSLLVGNRPQQVGDDEGAPRSNRQRVAFWLRQIQLASHGDFARQRFASHFGTLILDILAYRGEIDREGSPEALAGASLDAPAPVKEFLRLRMAPFDTFAADGRQRSLISRLKSSVSKLLIHRKRRLESPVDAEVLVVVHYLEHELEVENIEDGN